jgi:hypothetical protein
MFRAGPRQCDFRASMREDVTRYRNIALRGYKRFVPARLRTVDVVRARLGERSVYRAAR